MKCKKCSAAEAEKSGFCRSCEHIITASANNGAPSEVLKSTPAETAAERHDKINKIKIAARIAKMRENSDFTDDEVEQASSAVEATQHYTKWFTSNNIAIAIFIISALFLLVSGRDGGKRLDIFLTSVASLFIVFLFAEKSIGSDKMFGRAVIKTAKFSAALLLIVMLKKCAVTHSNSGGPTTECEYGVGATTICRTVY